MRILSLGMPKASSFRWHRIWEEVSKNTPDLEQIFMVDSPGKQHTKYDGVKNLLEKNTKALCIHRDIRDVLCSVLQTIRGDYENRTGRELGNMSWDECARYLVIHKDGVTRWVSWFLTYWNQPNVIMVKYEDLCKHPKETLEAVGWDLGIKMDSSVIERAVENTSWKKEYERRPQKMSDGKVGKFREMLPKDVIRDIQEYYKIYFVISGYDLEAL